MDILTKIYVTNPFQVNLVKMFSDKICKCKDLIVA